MTDEPSVFFMWYLLVAIRSCLSACISILVPFICVLIIAQRIGEGTEVVGLLQVKRHFFLKSSMESKKSFLLGLSGFLLSSGSHL